MTRHSTTRDQVAYLKEIGVDTRGLPECAENPPVARVKAKLESKKPVAKTMVDSSHEPARVERKPAPYASPVISHRVSGTGDGPPMGVLIFVVIVMFLLILASLRHGG